MARFYHSPFQDSLMHIAKHRNYDLDPFHRLELFKTAAKAVSVMRNEEIVRNYEANGGPVSLFFDYLVEMFNNDSADLRIFATQEFDILLKRVLAVSNTLALRIVVSRIREKQTPARTFKELLIRLDFLIHRIDPPIRELVTQGFQTHADQIVMAIKDKLSCKEVIVHSAIEKLAPFMICHLPADPNLIKDLFQFSLNYITSKNSVSYRSCAAIAAALCGKRKEFIDKGVKQCKKHLARCFDSNEYPSVGVFHFLQNVFCHLSNARNFENLEKIAKNLLISANVLPTEMIFSVLAALTEFVSHLPKELLLFTFPQEPLETNNVEDPTAEIIIDPLLNASLYDKEHKPSIDQTLPRSETIICGGAQNFYHYVAGFLVKKFLHFTLKKTDDGFEIESDVRSSLQVIALQCLTVIAEKEPLINISVPCKDNSQKVLDIRQLALTTDNSLKQKAIWFIPQLLKYDKTQNSCNDILRQLITVPDLNVPQHAKTLLEAFGESHIKYLEKSDVLEGMIDFATFCASLVGENESYPLIFLSTALPVSGKVRVSGQLSMDKLKCQFLDKLKANHNLLFDGSTMNSCFRTWKVEKMETSIGLSSGLKLVNNCAENRLQFSWTPRSDEKMFRAYELLEYMTKEYGKDVTDVWPIVVESCKHVVEMTPETVLFDMYDLMSADMLELFCFRKETVLSCLQVIAEVTYRKMLELSKKGSAQACKEVAEKLLLLGIRCVDFYNVVSADPEPRDRLLKREPYTFDKYESLREVFQDFAGVIKNYKGSSSFAADQKAFDFIEVISNLVCNALEFMRFEQFDDFLILIQLIDDLLTIKIDCAIKIMHQLFKMLFAKNMGSLQLKEWTAFEMDQKELQNIEVSEFYNGLVEMKYHEEMLERQRGYISENRGFVPIETRRTIEDALVHFEPLLHKVIKIFHNRGYAERKQIYLMMTELLLNGIEYKQADSSNVCMKEMRTYVFYAVHESKRDVFPETAQFLVAHARKESRNYDELRKYTVDLLKAVVPKNEHNVTYIIEAVQILFLELIRQEEELNEIIEEFGRELLMCLRRAPRQTLAISHAIFWFLKDKTDAPEPKQKFYADFLKAYSEWAMDEESGDLGYDSLELLYPLSLLPITAVLDEMLKFAYGAIKKRNSKVDAFLLILASNLEPGDSKEQNSRHRSQCDFLKRTFLLPPTTTYPRQKSTNEAIREGLRLNHLDVLESVDEYIYRDSVINALKLAKMRGNSSLRHPPGTPDFTDSDAEKVITFESVLRNEIFVACNYVTASRILINRPVAEIWKLLKTVGTKAPEKFWIALLTEFRIHLLPTEQREDDKSKKFAKKIENLIHMSYLDQGEDNSNYYTLIKLVFYAKDLEFNFSKMTLHIYKSFMAVFFEVPQLDEQMARAIIAVNNDSNVRIFIERRVLDTLSVYIGLMSSWGFTVEMKERYEKVAKSSLLYDGCMFSKTLPTNFRGGRTFLEAAQTAYVYSRVGDSDTTGGNREVFLKVVLRHPIFYEFYMIPENCIRYGWVPMVKILADGKIDIALPKVHMWRDYATLADYESKLARVGWLSKKQFDNICVTLLGVLASTPSGPEILHHPSVYIDENMEISELAIRILTQILLMSVKFPLYGSPMSKYVIKYREKIDPFFKSPEYQSYAKLKSIFRGVPKIAASENLERFNSLQGWTSLTEKFGPNQLPVVSLLTLCGLLDNSPKDGGSKMLTGRVLPSYSQFLFETASDLDTVSNVRSLLDCFNHWLQRGISHLPTLLLTGVVRSLAYLSDFFNDVNNYEFVLHNMKIAFFLKACRESPEEGLIIFDMLKSISVLGVENREPDIQKTLLSWIDEGLNNSHTSATHTLAGLLYLFDSTEFSNISAVVDYVSRYLLDQIESFFCKDPFRPIDLSKFALSCMVNIIQNPHSSKYKSALEEKLFHKYVKTSFPRDIDLLTEAIEMLICSSMEFGDRYLNFLEKYLKTSVAVLTSPKSCGFLRTLIAVLYRYAGSNDEARHLKILTIHELIIKIFHFIAGSEYYWVLRILPSVFEKTMGIELCLKQLAETIQTCKDASVWKFVSLFEEMMQQIHERHDWSAEFKGWKTAVEFLVEKIDRGENVTKTLKKALEPLWPLDDPNDDDDEESGSEYESD